MKLHIHTSGAEAFQIEGNIFKSKVLHRSGDGLVLVHEMVKIFRIDFDSKNRLVESEAHVIEAETAQPFFPPMNRVEQCIVKGRIIGETGGHARR